MINEQACVSTRSTLSQGTRNQHVSSPFSYKLVSPCFSMKIFCAGVPMQKDKTPWPPLMMFQNAACLQWNLPSNMELRYIKSCTITGICKQYNPTRTCRLYPMSHRNALTIVECHAHRITVLSSNNYINVLDKSALPIRPSYHDGWFCHLMQDIGDS